MEEHKTKAVIDIFDKYAQSYEDKYMSVEKYQVSLDFFCSKLSSDHVSILELTCGPGNITKYLLDTIPTLNILATDLSPAMLRLAQNNNPNAKFQLLDCRSILDLRLKFDAIICGFGLPYISKGDAIQLIKDASRSLNRDGLLYLSTMEDQYSKSGFKSSSSDPKEGLFTYFHQEDYLVDALENFGFEIMDISRVEYVDDKNENVVDLTLVCKLIH